MLHDQDPPSNDASESAQPAPPASSEDALYDGRSLRDCAGIDRSHESVPDATTLQKFWRLLPDNDLTQAPLDEINAHLAEK